MLNHDYMAGGVRSTLERTHARTQRHVQRPVSTYWGDPQERRWGFYCPVTVSTPDEVYIQHVSVTWGVLESWGGVIPCGETLAFVYPGRVVPVYDSIDSRRK
jgi:hypothetical protein